MTTLDWLIVLVLNGGVIAAGIYFSRGTATSGEWFLGNRSLAWWVVALSMFATNVDNADLVSLGGTAYKEGMHIITVHTLGSLVGGILAVFFIVPAIYRAGFYTNAEYLEARFGPATRLLSALIQIQYRTSMLGLMIWSIYLLLTGLMEVPPRLAWTLIVFMVVFAAIYTAWGGLRSVALTDVMQGLIMMIGTGVIVATVWQIVGGWSGAIESLESMKLQNGEPMTDLFHIGQYRGDSGSTLPIVVVLGWIVIGSGYWTVNHTQTMRLLGSRSLWDMKMAALAGVAISMPMMIACASLGVFGRKFYPAFDQPDQLYPMLANQFLGPGLKGLVVAGILAAAISTFDSMGASLSAVFTRDIYARFFVRNREDAHYVRTTRLATIIILALGFLYLPFISSKDTMLKAFLTLIPVFVTPLFTVYLAGTLTPAHRKSGVAGIIVGGAYGLIALYNREMIQFEWLPSWFTGRWEALLWSMLITGAAMAVTTLLLGKNHGTSETENDPDSWLQKSRQSLPKLREHPFPNQIPSLLDPRWIAVGLTITTIGMVFGLFW